MGRESKRNRENNAKNEKKGIKRKFEGKLSSFACIHPNFMSKEKENL